LIEPVDAEVIIIGGGPAGSTAAFSLSSAGVSVLLLEKAIFPRYKVCGAGLTHKILTEIPFDITPVIESTITSIRFSCRFREEFTRIAKNPIMYCTTREKLDQFMLNKALLAGTRVLFGEKVINVRMENDRVGVWTENRKYLARIVIGAEGATGIIARSAGLRMDILPGLAWEGEIFPGESFLTKYADTVFLDWGTFPGGYGWIFPKKDHVSIGVGGPATLSKWMMPYYQSFLCSAGLLKNNTDKSRKRTGNPVIKILADTSSGKKREFSL
jgi:flavin-dependent dehydrogenase